jgi:hypothetical protein
MLMLMLMLMLGLALRVVAQPHRVRLADLASVSHLHHLARQTMIHRLWQVALCGAQAQAQA